MSLILGIESSCDETAASVVENGFRVLSSEVASQIAKHAVHGGVVPELAAREHLKALTPVVSGALKTAGVTLKDISAIAVNYECVCFICKFIAFFSVALYYFYINIVR